MRYFKVTGWGPFRLPGEKRRLNQAEETAYGLFQILNKLPKQYVTKDYTDEQLYPELEEDE